MLSEGTSSRAYEPPIWGPFGGVNDSIHFIKDYSKQEMADELRKLSVGGTRIINQVNLPILFAPFLLYFGAILLLGKLDSTNFPLRIIISKWSYSRFHAPLDDINSGHQDKTKHTFKKSLHKESYHSKGNPSWTSIFNHFLRRMSALIDPHSETHTVGKITTGIIL